ncbi:hypothetical protein [Dyella amyloliquefaciens]|uniref:hypothetical protein n=1 Tax=Dyella amyloliquefaciens TaxID=1770545 RepID=UPI00102E5D14|nr:hypothetical protein [Dyella amyloliquefaciens]
MKSIYSICEHKGQRWCVSLDQKLVETELSPAMAITLARRLAREYHDATGVPALVEFVGGEEPIVLGSYGVH